MPAGSIAVTPMSFWPATIGREIANLPFSSAAPDTVRFDVAFQTRTSLRACVSPSIEAVFALTTAPSRGLLTTIRGIVASKTYVTTGDGSDSPASETIVAVNAFAPSASVTSGTTKRTVRPTGISVTTPGSPSPIAT